VRLSEGVIDYGIVHSKAAKTKITKLRDLQIRVVRYWENGNVKTEGDYNEMPDKLKNKAPGTERFFEHTTEDGTKFGLHNWYHENGNKFKSINYTDGYEDMTGAQICHDNGRVMEQGDIVMGTRVGKWEYYTKEGELTHYEHYSEDGSTIEVPIFVVPRSKE
jgi:antitoxin component YwqK of YwqJK toxin-antitoxin module